jgi:Trk K+ transport system NAD-binding subunit
MQQTVIVCGLGRVGWPVLDYLRAAGLTIVAIDLHARPDDPRLAGVRFIEGDCRQKEILQKAGLESARGILILTGDDLVNIATTLTVRALHADVRIVVRLFNQNLMARLGKAVRNVYALSVPELTAPVLALTALTGAGLGTFEVEDGLMQVAEIVVRDRLAEQTIGEVARRHQLHVLAYLPGRGGERLLLDVEPETHLRIGDRLFVCGNPAQLQPLQSGGEEMLPHLHWAGALRRHARVVAETFREIELPVKLATAVLLIVVVSGTLVYHYGMNRPVGQSLLRTISVIATAADLHEEDATEEWQKGFIGLLRLMGTVLVAAFTAILTNYLVRARLFPALEVRRIPDSGHVVVCGLGNVGFRVVEELLDRGEQAVAIERSSDSRFIGTARRRGAAVILGDATVQESLQQANADKARAVIAATDNQLANLEIALLVRELNPRQRVVVRMSDPHLAEVLRETANVRFAFSTGGLAAPAFVAALFGDRVLNLFQLAGKVLAAVELTLLPGDSTLAGLQVRALAGECRFLPICLRSASGHVREQTFDHVLQIGDTLTVIVSLPDLARLLRRER